MPSINQQQDPEYDNTEDGGDPVSLRIAQRQARVQAEREKEEKANAAVPNPIQQGTSQLLRFAWEALIPSWGLSLIYIDLHALLRLVFGKKLFCKYGEEWLPKEVGQLGGSSGLLGLAEVFVLIFVNVVYWGIIITIIGLLAMLTNFMLAPWYEQIGVFIKSFMDLDWSGIQALVDMFKGIM